MKWLCLKPLNHLPTFPSPPIHPSPSTRWNDYALDHSIPCLSYPFHPSPPSWQNDYALDHHNPPALPSHPSCNDYALNPSISYPPSPYCLTSPIHPSPPTWKNYYALDHHNLYPLSPSKPSPPTLQNDYAINHPGRLKIEHLACFLSVFLFFGENW